MKIQAVDLDVDVWWCVNGGRARFARDGYWIVAMAEDALSDLRGEPSVVEPPGGRGRLWPCGAAARRHGHLGGLAGINEVATKPIELWRLLARCHEVLHSAERAAPIDKTSCRERHLDAPEGDRPFGPRLGG